jgi:hypothetical protein
MAKAKRKERTMQPAPGYDGHVIVNTLVKITETRFDKRPTRCKPGSFEWSYGARKDNSKIALYHAGVHFSGLWEKAHVTARSPNLVPTSAPTAYRGLPDSRAEALSEIRALGKEIGTYAMSRLIDYCILGNTTEEIGRKYGMDRKAMHHVLQCDLTDVATHFRFT